MKIIFTKTAAHDLKNLPPDVRRHVIGVLQRSKINPWRYVRRLIGTEWYRLRAGDYRIIVKIESNTIYVLYIAHRKKMYKGI